jgi:hypothetical protein
VPGLPQGGHTDQLAIRGDCDALYLHTGDKYEPWVPVEERDQVWGLQVSDELHSGRARLLEVTGAQTQTVDVEVLDNREARIVVRIGDRTVSGETFEIPSDGRFTLGLKNLLDLGFYRVESTPGGVAAFVESVYFDSDWNSIPALVEPAYDETHLASLGLAVQAKQGLDIPLCREVAERAGIDLSQS